LIKTLLTYIFVFGLLFTIGYHVHEYLLKEQVDFMPFSLKAIYIFHAIFSFLICTFLLLISKKDKLKDQLGFLYLGTFVFKLVVFAMIFSALFFGDLQLTLKHKVSLLIPVFIFLVPEAYFIVKILSKLNTDKK
jgi:hypothetical protein